MKAREYGIVFLNVMLLDSDSYGGYDYSNVHPGSGLFGEWTLLSLASRLRITFFFLDLCIFMPFINILLTEIIY